MENPDFKSIIKEHLVSEERNVQIQHAEHMLGMAHNPEEIREVLGSLYDNAYLVGCDDGLKRSLQ
jgi:hypothetical protein